MLRPIAILLLLVGIPMLVVAARAATRAYRANQLATRGVFAIVRNPIYSAWIVFILPGLVLLSPSWPLLLTPLVAALVFKLRIRRENEYLERQFGAAYRRYRAEVNELIPVPRRSSRQEPPWPP
jgi:protein-S-isoprenylcysteine O-methyltransferase Ste14